MMKRFLLCLTALALLLTAAACAESYDGYSYTAHCVEYDAAAVSGWNVMRYAEAEGVLLDMYSDTASVSVQLVSASEAPSLDALAQQHLDQFSGYATILSDVVTSEWYVSWRESEPGRKLAFSYAYTGMDGSTVYQVADYLLRLDPEYFVLVELTDWSGEVSRTTSWLEAGFLESFRVESFPVTGSSSACLTGAQMSDGALVLTLQPYAVEMTADDADYVMVPDGDPVQLAAADTACILAPAADDGGFLTELALDADMVNRFIGEYRSRNGQDCVFNILISNGKIVWMTFSYLMM